MSVADKIKYLQLKFKCGVNQARHRGLIVCDYSATASWGLIAANNTFIIKPTAKAVHPFAMILEGHRQSNFGSKEAVLARILDCNYGDMVSPFLCGFSNNVAYAATYHKPYQNHLFNLGRYYLDTMMNIKLPYPVRPSWKMFKAWEV